MTHKDNCCKMVTKMPNDDKKTVSFEHFERKMDVPFTIYADFECILEEVGSPGNASSSSSISSSLNIQKHIPCAGAYFIKSCDSSLNRFKMFKGSNCVKDFVSSLIKDCYELHKRNSKPMLLLSEIDLEYQRNCPLCHICNKELGTDRVADHCHYTGKYNGPAHNKCNLIYQKPKFFPILFHNFTGYDSHLLIKELASYNGNISCIPLNKERYISVSKTLHTFDNRTIELRFLDSLRFMPSSIDSLTKDLTPSDFKLIRSNFPIEEEFKLLTRKGVFPYDHVKTWESLEEKTLPPQECFKNKLTGEACSDSEYNHAKKVWTVFKCQTLSDYMELYLKTDVLLLADIFENFKIICKSIYELDPCHYYTAPGLSWDAMLRKTHIKLDLIQDIEIYNFIKKGIRGGISQCSHRHSVANNKYMQNYDETKDSQYLMYVDANNLYGWAMSCPLPYSSIKWVNNIQNIDLMNISDDSEVGYIYEVDLEYPDSLHECHNDLPFCVQNKKVNQSKFSKLIADLTPKQNYVIHYKNLQQCIKNGLKLIRIHRVLQFKQSRWLQKYIDLNNQHRTLATSDFEKNFFKLMNNSVFGKTMENVDKRKDVKIVTSWGSHKKRLGARALIAKPNFHSLTKFTDEMTAIQMKRVNTYYDKPLYLGFCVLEFSKWKMYDFHYSYMQPKYGNCLKLNYMDTDSFIYTIKTHDFYNDIQHDIDSYFDTSAYSVDNPYNIPIKNKKVLGMMKDENSGKIMKEFIGLRSKMYSYSVEETEVKKAKGVKKIALNDINLASYKDCLYNKRIFHGEMFVFRSFAHQIYTQQLNKIVLSHLDDKRYIREDGVSTYAWGHYQMNTH